MLLSDSDMVLSDSDILLSDSDRLLSDSYMLLRIYLEPPLSYLVEHFLTRIMGYHPNHFVRSSLSYEFYFFFVAQCCLVFSHQ